MFTIHYSNQLEALAEMFIQHQRVNPNEDPFQSETILVQSVGMAQWLQMQIAKKMGIAGNYQFPFPTSFLWQQYRLLFPHLPKENIFERNVMAWRLMRIIPTVLDKKEFHSLNAYLSRDNVKDSVKLYQLAIKIADLFDQYLVYRPHWLVHWENHQWQMVVKEIQENLKKNSAEIEENVLWQSILWNLLVEDTKKEYDDLLFITSHRAYLQQRYFDKLESLTEEEKAKLPKRIFIFGISSLPSTQLAVFLKLSEYCDVNLFFLNPSKEYWGESIENIALEKFALKQHLSKEEIENLLAQQGNQLLSMWGKQGRDFFYQLSENSPSQIEFFQEYYGENNLSRLKQAIFEYNNEVEFNLHQDNSIQIHSCYSPMREIEVLHNQLRYLFEQDPTLLPKDIIVMAPDIEKYTPYINAVFSQTEKTKDHIPFAISDQKITTVDPIISSFLSLLALKESVFSAEALLDLLEVNAIGQKFDLSAEGLSTIRHWIDESGIRAAPTVEQESGWQNYNSWENGLNRLLLGTSLREENGIWQETVAFSESYGLSAELVGKLAEFIEKLTAWVNCSTQKLTITEWKKVLDELLKSLYFEDDITSQTLFGIQQALNHLASLAMQANFEQEIEFDVVAQVLRERLNQETNVMHFMTGKVNFCTLLPMRAIPFKVVCLLGMNESDFPRQVMINSFDLMQHSPKKGDRARREDDRYLFLEALLSAKNVFYLSYVGQSLVKSEKRNPSVLVAQLLDYLVVNSQPEEFDDNEGRKLSREKAEQWIQYHPMSAFSRKNFQAGYISYDKVWFDFAKQAVDFEDFFAKPLPKKNEESSTIDLDDLITYIQSPVKDFFTQNFGIYFKEENDDIAESENFALSGLQEYQLLDELLEISNEDSETFFEKAMLKGEMPVNNFGKITQLKFSEYINAMQSSLSNYLSQESEIFPFNLRYRFDDKEIELEGNLPNIFGNELVLWRVGRLRDKDKIKLWIYFLILKSLNKTISPKYYFLEKSKNKVDCFSFNEIETEQAKNILRCYINDYLKNRNQLVMAISYDISKYLDNILENDVTLYCEKYINELIALSEGNEYQKSTFLRIDDGLYLKRILVQTDKLDYQVIHQNTLNWFDLMNKYTFKEEKKGK